MDNYFDYSEHNKTVFSFIIGDYSYSLIADDDTADDVIMSNIQTFNDCLVSALEVLDEEGEAEGSPDVSIRDIADVVLDTIFKVTGISFKIVGVGPVLLSITADDTEE